MSKSGFGDHLRREREMRGVSLNEIAGATRISTRFLEALETEAWERLPGGVFNRGFVRTVARFLGLEEESLLAEYSLAKGEPNVPLVSATIPAQQTAAIKPRRQIPWLALAAIPVVLILAGGGWFCWQWASARQAELNAAANSLPAAPAPPSAPSSLWAGAADLANGSSAVTQDPQAVTSPWAAPAGQLQLKIDAAKGTSVTVTSDGQPVFSGNIAAGQSRIIRARTALTVEAQDAGAIHLELNGQPLAPIGPAGQPGKITLGRPSAPPNAGGHD